MSDILKLCGASVIAVILSVILKNRSSPLAPFLTEITAVLIISSVISALIPFVSFIKGILSDGGVKYDVLGTLLKTCVITIVCQTVYDICKENGENMLANAVEFAGNVEIMLLSLPLITGLIKDTFSILNV